MRKLFLQLTLLLGATALVGVLTVWQALQRPYLDAFYTRFTTPPASSLVLGTSRAAQAVQPGVLRARLGARFTGPWLNYSFTLAESPYGPTYLASIRRKLDPATRHGLFVVAVDPWALSEVRQRKTKDEELAFPEDNQLLAGMHQVSRSPNLEYLAHTRQPLYQIALHDTTSIVRLHADGWLEVALPLNSRAQQEHEATRLATYRELATTAHLSAARLNSLRELVAFLKPHGRVVFVRIPTGPAMAAIEQAYQPGFDRLMQQTARAQGVPYLNYIDAHYTTTDGNHLWHGEAPAFSQRLAEDIKKVLY